MIGQKYRILYMFMIVQEVGSVYTIIYMRTWSDGIKQHKAPAIASIFQPAWYTLVFYRTAVYCYTLLHIIAQLHKVGAGTWDYVSTPSYIGLPWAYMELPIILCMSMFVR